MQPFDYNTSQVFMRDRMVPFAEAQISVVSSPVLYGLAVYTVCNVNIDPNTGKAYVFRLRDHYDRLIASAKIMDLADFYTQWDYQKFENMVMELLHENNVKQQVLVRITVYVDELLAGARMHGLKNSVNAVIYAPLTDTSPGIDVCVSSWQRTPDNAIPARAKITGSYANAALMKNEAVVNGYDDAIAIDEHGHVSESTVSNLFLVRKGKLLTPHTGTDLLEGITRDSILELAQQLGITAEERSIDRSELYIADEVFVCGSSMWVTPVLSVDKNQIGVGTIGPITLELRKAYADAQTNPNGPFKNWLVKI